MKERALALDALRGYAIITMVLSGTIAASILPAWMTHCQVPPPDLVYNPLIPGITWVDLVFPTFLFAMGAAFPFSIGKKFERGETKCKLALQAVWRSVMLTFFAIFIQHFYPWVTGDPSSVRASMLAIFCFVMLFPIYMRLPWQMPTWARYAIQYGAVAIGIAVMLSIYYPDDKPFDLHDSNIIIIILANMALFASLLYVFTIDHPKVRIAILALLFALMLGASEPGSWEEPFATYSPVTWFYNPLYLRYLFIVIPGAFAGELLVKWMKSRKENVSEATTKVTALMILGTTLAIVIVNLYCLYMRFVAINLIANILLIVFGFYALKRNCDYGKLWKSLFTIGAFMLIMGLLIEPFEDGIKKDPVNFSYVFTTAGLGFMILIFFSVLCDYFKLHKSTSFLVMSGQNPMVAYVSTSLLVMPLLKLCGIYSFFDVFMQSPWLGFLEGVLLTSLAVLVTMFFTKIKWMWRT